MYMHYIREIPKINYKKTKHHNEQVIILFCKGKEEIEGIRNSEAELKQRVYLYSILCESWVIVTWPWGSHHLVSNVQEGLPACHRQKWGISIYKTYKIVFFNFQTKLLKCYTISNTCSIIDLVCDYKCTRAPRVVIMLVYKG
jgi:hypothetical protein